VIASIKVTTRKIKRRPAAPQEVKMSRRWVTGEGKHQAERVFGVDLCFEARPREVRGAPAILAIPASSRRNRRVISAFKEAPDDSRRSAATLLLRRR
jgi:hypothetical protein